jgi:hypothetical protein
MALLVVVLLGVLVLAVSVDMLIVALTRRR